MGCGSIKASQRRFRSYMVSLPGTGKWGAPLDLSAKWDPATRR